jgi:hypothetical protein
MRSAENRSKCSRDFQKSIYPKGETDGPYQRPRIRLGSLKAARPSCLRRFRGSEGISCPCSHYDPGMGSRADFVKYCQGVGKSWRAAASGGALTVVLAVLSRVTGVPSWAWITALILTAFAAPYRYCVGLARELAAASQQPAPATPAVHIDTVESGATVNVQVNPETPPMATSGEEGEEPG